MSKRIGSKEYNEWLNSPLTKALKKSFEMTTETKSLLDAAKQFIFEWGNSESSAAVVFDSLNKLRAAIQEAERQKPKEWHGLTLEEIEEIRTGPVPEGVVSLETEAQAFARAIEAKLKEKNT